MAEPDRPAGSRPPRLRQGRPYPILFPERYQRGGVRRPLGPASDSQQRVSSQFRAAPVEPEAGPYTGRAARLARGESGLRSRVEPAYDEPVRGADADGPGTRRLLSGVPVRPPPVP